MNSVTKDLIEILTKAAKDNSSGGGFGESEGAFRKLFEPSKGNNSIAGLIKTLDKKQLETAWQQQYKAEEGAPYDLMKLAIENDFVSQLHRDLQHRYSGRISRMLHENARKESHAIEPDGLIAAIANRINYFNQLEPIQETQ